MGAAVKISESQKHATEIREFNTGLKGLFSHYHRIVESIKWQEERGIKDYNTLQFLHRRKGFIRALIEDLLLG